MEVALRIASYDSKLKMTCSALIRPNRIQSRTSHRSGPRTAELGPRILVSIKNDGKNCEMPATTRTMYHPVQCEMCLSTYFTVHWFVPFWEAMPSCILTPEVKNVGKWRVHFLLLFGYLSQTPYVPLPYTFFSHNHAAVTFTERKTDCIEISNHIVLSHSVAPLAQLSFPFHETIVLIIIIWLFFEYMSLWLIVRNS